MQTNPPALKLDQTAIDFADTICKRIIGEDAKPAEFDIRYMDPEYGLKAIHDRITTTKRKQAYSIATLVDRFLQALTNKVEAEMPRLAAILRSRIGESQDASFANLLRDEYKLNHPD